MLLRQDSTHTILPDNDNHDGDNNHSSVATSLAVDDDHIIVGMTNGNIYVFNEHDATLAGVLDAHHGGVWCLALGSILAPVIEQVSGQAKHEDAEGPQQEERLQERDVRESSQVSDKRDVVLVSGGNDGIAKVWNTTNG